jgi:hypothetical protein
MIAFLTNVENLFAIVRLCGSVNKILSGQLGGSLSDQGVWWSKANKGIAPNIACKTCAIDAVTVAGIPNGIPVLPEVEVVDLR